MLRGCVGEMWKCVVMLLCVWMSVSKVDGEFHKVPKHDNTVHRFRDLSFQRDTSVLNKTVTCSGDTWGVFPAMTYTCDDIKVDGLRLAYGYYPGMGVDDSCQETRGTQELSRLCRHLLRKVDNRHATFFGVFVNNATCDRSQEDRYLFMKNTPHSHMWIRMDPGNGWLSSISCMVRT